MIGTIRISQLPQSGPITGAENLIVNQLGDTRLTTVNQVVGILTYVSLSGISTNVIGGIASVTSLSVSGVSTLGFVTATNSYFSGVVTATTFVGNLSGNSTTAGIATYAITAGISTVSQGLTGTPNITVGVITASTFIGNLTGTATTATNVIGGIASVTSLNVSGISTLGSVQISSGIVTATTGIVTYYGDGSKLSNIISGVGIQSSGVNVGSGVTTLNFIGAGNTFSVDGSTVNISIQGGGGGGVSSQWVTTPVGIHTLSNVGIGTTNPTTKLHVSGDVNLDDGGTYTTTLQTITPTANRTLSLPDATGTIALIAGSSGQLIYNLAGAYSGVVNSGIDTLGNVTLGSRLTSSLNGAASAPPVSLTGTWFTGGTSTTTKPQLLIEPSGTTSTSWSTSGTGLGLNAASGFTGNLLDLQVNGSRFFNVSSAGKTTFGGSASDQCFIEALGTRLGLSGTATISLASLDAANGFMIDARSDRGISFIGASLTSTASRDLYITRDAAGTLAQRNATNAQTFRCYGTYTDASNYVRAALSSTSTAVTLAAETAGTGADDVPLNLTAAGTGTVKVNSNLEIADAKDIVLATTTGTKIGTATTQKLAFYNATPVVQPAAVANITTTATAGTLPTADGSVTIADAATPTVAELLEYCVELEAKLEAALGHLRTLGLIAT